jgi:hypothetical protein
MCVIEKSSKEEEKREEKETRDVMNKCFLMVLLFVYLLTSL